MAAEVAKALYIVVVDDVGKITEKGRESFRYTRTVLQSTLQLMGCKPRHAFKIVQRVFELVRNDPAAEALLPEALAVSSEVNPLRVNSEKDDGNGLVNTSIDNHLPSEKDDKRKSEPFELYKRRTTIVVKRATFLDVVCSALSEYKYVGPNQKADLMLACRIRERKESVTVLLCGTSGCGKSTLSSLLGSRLGITTVVSTDSIRHMMRSFVDETQNPLLWASTYHAGEYLDPVAVAEAKAKRKAKKLDETSSSPIPKDESTSNYTNGKIGASFEVTSACTQLISPKQMAVEGFKAQSEMVIDSLDRLITAWEERKESVVIEGVHLSLNFVMGLMKEHPSIIPFMIYITNEGKHMERFAVRAKYMTLDPSRNKYVKYIRNIRTIQDYLCKRADKHLVPKINNTNVDRSVATIHATVFSCLRRRESGESLYDATTNKVSMVHEEYMHQCAANSTSSKRMFQLIQRNGSSRNLMAMFNNDGSVAKVWPVNSVDGNGSETGIGNPWYGPLQIGKAEPVNLQFGHLGISAWPSDGGTSYAGSVDEFRAEGTDTGSKYYSSCCSSPRTSDGPSKELKEEPSVHGSEEEMDDPLEADTDDDLSDDDDQQIHDEVGSVDEEFTKSDEEYDDLAMEDMQRNGYYFDVCYPNSYEEEGGETVLHFPQTMSTAKGMADDKYSQNLNLFLGRSMKNNGELLTQDTHPHPLCSYDSTVMMGRSESRAVASSLGKNMRTRSLSIPPLRSEGSLMNDPILSTGVRSHPT